MYSLIRNHKRLSYLVVFVFMLTMVFTPVQSAWADPGTFKDVQGHWAQDTIEAMAKAGIISGNPDGTFDPEGRITRAQFATIVVKAYQMTGSGKVFADTASHWGKNYIAAANANGVVSGYSDSKFGPDDPITREQMAVMIVKAARLDPSAAAVNFTDQAKISAWALSAVATAYAHNIIKGMPDGSFAPQDYATRAQAAVVVYAGLNTKTPPPAPEENYSLIDKAGTYGPTSGTKTVSGNVTIKAPGVTLQNLVIKGDLIIAQEVGDGDVTLNNIKVEGKTYVRGGGKDSIHINGGQYSEIIVEKTATGQVRIVTVDASGIKVIVAENAKGEEIILNGDFKSVTVNADNVNITTQGQTNIGELKIESGLKDVNIELAPNSTVNEMVLNSKTNVEGQGTIKEASGSKANESSFATPPSTITKPSTGGGGSGGSSTVAVSAISVAPETMTLYAGGATGKITATVAPTNATNKNATWTTSDAKVATVANGVVTPVAAGTATITATSAANSSKKASCEVTVEEPIAGTFESTGNVGIAPDTAGDAAGKIYAEYKLVTGEGEDNAQTISLAKDKVEYIKVKVVKVGEGEWKDLTANTDATLWFNVEAATGSRTFEVKTKGEEGTVYIAALDWDEKIKTATWQATGGEGDHEGVTYVEYKLMDGDQVSLKIGEVKLIASKDAEGKWVELDPNTDETLWFNKAKATGNYDFFVVTKDGVMYKATLDWQGGDVYTALAAVNAYLTSEKYIYAKAPEALESHLTKLGLQVGDESDYAALDKAATGGKNRKTAVFYDLNNNKPGEGYDLPTLTTYFNDMVATRLVTEASMDLVNNAENIEALNGISFVTMLLERFQTVSYGTHSDIPVTEKIATLQGLVNRYNGLDADGQAAVLAKIIEKRPTDGYARSQATTDALKTALDEITFLTMSADDVTATIGVEFTMPVTTQGTVADADKEHKVRFYGVIPGLTADDIEFAAISGGTPEIVTDATERSYAGANHDDIVLAWGPDGGFPLKSYDYSQGVTTEFKATINKAGTYTVKFVFYDIDGQKRLNGEDETATITVTGS